MTNIDKRKWSNSDDSRDKVWLFWRNAARSTDTHWIKIKIIICNVQVIKWFQLWKVDLTGSALHLQQGQIMCREQGREESKLVKKCVQKCFWDVLWEQDTREKYWLEEGNSIAELTYWNMSVVSYWKRDDVE